MMLYWVLKGILTPVLRFFYRVRVEGLEHVPRSGPAILASNHLSFSDSIFLPLVLRRRVTFVAKAEYFDDPKTAWLFRALGQITDEIMFELRQLSGQEYVDSYSARKQVVGVADEARVRTTPPPEPIAAAG